MTMRSACFKALSHTVNGANEKTYVWVIKLPGRPRTLALRLAQIRIEQLHKALAEGWQ